MSAKKEEQAFLKALKTCKTGEDFRNVARLLPDPPEGQEDPDAFIMEQLRILESLDSDTKDGKTKAG